MQFRKDWKSACRRFDSDPRHHLFYPFPLNEKYHNNPINIGYYWCSLNRHSLPRAPFCSLLIHLNKPLESTHKAHSENRSVFTNPITNDTRYTIVLCQLGSEIGSASHVCFPSTVDLASRPLIWHSLTSELFLWNEKVVETQSGPLNMIWRLIFRYGTFRFTYLARKEWQAVLRIIEIWSRINDYMAERVRGLHPPAPSRLCPFLLQ